MRVINCFTDPRLGGPGTRSIAVGEELSRRGVDVHFLIPEGGDSLANEAVNAGFTVHRVPLPRLRSSRMISENLRFLTSFRHTTRRIRKLLDSVSADIVHVNTPYNFQTARAAYRSTGALVWHFNDTLTPWPINRVAGRSAKRWADEIVVAADAVHEHFFPARVETRTIYPPVDLDDFDSKSFSDEEPSLRDELGLGDDGPVVGTVGNINPAKGHEYLLEAIPEVLDYFPKAKLLIVGSKLDSQRGYFDRLQRKLAEFDIEDSVQFTGWRSDIPNLLSVFDLFVLPSITEACPIVVLEAMAMCCPVVATNVGGVSEQLPSDDYGWVVPPKDVDSLAEGIIQALASDSGCHDRARRAHQRVASVFSLEECVDNHIQVYQLANKYNKGRIDK